MSVALEPETAHHARHGRRDQPGRPGQAVLRADRADDKPADGLRHRRDVAHAQRHLPRSRLPADRRHRPDAGPGGQGRRGGRHPADRRGRRHRAGRRARPVEVGARGRPARYRFRPGHRYDSGAQRRSRPDGGSRRPAPGGNDHDHRAADAVGLPDHLVRRHRRPRPGGAPRLRLLRSAAPDQPHPRRLVRHRAGGRHSRDL